MTGPPGTLQARKQKLVRDAIWDAAIDLFAEKGFDRTTVEEIAEAAGVSRRSFFRYFKSKDDLLAQGIITFGLALSEAIKVCPASLTLLATVRHTVVEVATAAAAQPRTRKIIRIAESSTSARQAQMSRLPEAEDCVAEAFAVCLNVGLDDDLRPRLLASLTFSMMDMTIRLWMKNEHTDISAAIERVFATFAQLVCKQEDLTLRDDSNVRARKASAPPRTRPSARTTHAK